jgi:hypothetical protein
MLNLLNNQQHSSSPLQELPSSNTTVNDSKCNKHELNSTRTKAAAKNTTTKQTTLVLSPLLTQY